MNQYQTNSPMLNTSSYRTAYRAPGPSGNEIQPQPCSITQVANMVKNALQQYFTGLIVTIGEISNLNQWHESLYFSLSDSQSTIKCVIYSAKAIAQNINLHHGMQVIVYAEVQFTKRGEIQLVVRRVLPAGIGLLEQQFQELKQRLEQEGLFSPAIKRNIPKYPSTVGVITSPNGDVIHDIYKNMFNCINNVRLVIYPATVQGRQAPPSLISQIINANQRAECDVLIIARGGGSFEDLFCFNDERLIRNIRASNIPIISAVGHETDFTLCDFAADLRVATPTQAGHYVVANYEDSLFNIENLYQSLCEKIYTKLGDSNTLLSNISSKLNILSPINQLEHKKQILEQSKNNLFNSIKSKINDAHLQLSRIEADFEKLGIKTQITNLRYELNDLEHSLHQSMGLKISSTREQLITLEQKLNQNSKLNIPRHRLDLVSLENELITKMKDILNRNFRSLEEYASKLNDKNPLTDPRFYKTTTMFEKNAINSIKDVKVGDKITTLLSDGSIESEVKSIEKIKRK